MSREIEKLLTAFKTAIGPDFEKLEEEWIPGVEPRIDVDKRIAEWLAECDLTNDRKDNIAFYRDAYRDGELNYRDIRKRGTPLSSDEKAKLGISGRTIMTAEFVATLGPAGLADPMSAALMIAGPSSQRCHTAEHLAKLATMNMRAEFIASNGAHGPCSLAGELNGRQFSAFDAPNLPLSGCSHPDQCFCMFIACSEI